MFRKAVRTRIMKKKPSLSAVLHETLQLQWDEIKIAMQKFPYFQNWSDKSIHQFCVHSNIVNYNENELILVKDDTNVYVTHFILEGSITVIQRLVVSKVHPKGEKNEIYKLHKNQNVDTSNKKNLESVFMQTCHLYEGACFGLGIGEHLSEHIIKANQGLKCLVVPKLILFQDYTPDNVWRRIILFLDMNYPSMEEVYQEFVRGRDWTKFSKGLYKHKMGDRKCLVNTVAHDIPLSVRAEDLPLLNSLKQFEAKHT